MVNSLYFSLIHCATVRPIHSKINVFANKQPHHMHQDTKYISQNKVLYLIMYMTLMLYIYYYYVTYR